MGGSRQAWLTGGAGPTHPVVPCRLTTVRPTAPPKRLPWPRSTRRIEGAKSGELGIAPYPGILVGEPLVRVSDLTVHPRRFSVDRPTCWSRHPSQLVRDFRAVDDGHPLSAAQCPVGALTGVVLAGGGVHIDGNEPTSTQ